jgi:type I restriction enzyme S subunit
VRDEPGDERRESVAIGDVAAINPENVDRSVGAREISYIDLASVKSEVGVISDSVQRLRCAEAPSRAKRLVRTGDLLVATVRPYLRGFARIGAEYEEAVASTGFAVLRPRVEGIEPGFLWAYLRTDAFVDQLVARQTGSNYPAVRPQDVAEARLPLPPRREQRRIADLLSTLDEVIERVSTQALLLKKLRNAARGHLCSKGDCYPVREVASFASGVAFPVIEQGRQGEFPFFKVSDMNADGNERRLFSAANWLDEEQMSRLKAKLWPEGTVVFPKVGAALKTEKRRLLVRPSAFDNNVMGLLPHPEVVLPYYLFLAMEGVRLSELSQEGAVPSVNQRLIGEIEIAVPSMSQQRRAVETMGELEESAEALSAHQRRLRSLREALLESLISADHQIPESYDRFLEEQPGSEADLGAAA